MHQQLTSLNALLEQLLAAPRVRVADVLARSSSPLAQVPGVYALYAPERPDQPVYVGRTSTKTVRGRMQDHCYYHITRPSDLAGMLKRHPHFPQEAKAYSVRWCEVADVATRDRFEKFAILALNPPFNRR